MGAADWNKFELPDGKVEAVFDFNVGEWAVVRGPLTAHTITERAGNLVRSLLGERAILERPTAELPSNSGPMYYKDEYFSTVYSIPGTEVSVQLNGSGEVVEIEFDELSKSSNKLVLKRTGVEFESALKSEIAQRLK